MNLVVYHCMSAYRLPRTCKAPVFFRLLVPGISRINTCTFWGPRFGVVVAGSFRSFTELAGRLRLQAYVVPRTKASRQIDIANKRARAILDQTLKPTREPRSATYHCRSPFPTTRVMTLRQSPDRPSQQTVSEVKREDRGLHSHPDQPRCWDRGGVVL